MKNDERTENSGSVLRRKAEEKIASRPPPAEAFSNEIDVRSLLHELQVHQVELEMQNAELQQSHDALKLLLDQYTSLYDFAPAGYLSLDRKGQILKLNHSMSGILGISRTRLNSQPLSRFIAESDQAEFTRFLQDVFSDNAHRADCELKLVRPDADTVVARLEGLADGSGRECMVAVSDITSLRLEEQKFHLIADELEELNRTLEERIRTSVDELRRKDQMLILQGRQAAMGEMINNIAHQWRQPLNTLGLYIQQLPNDLNQDAVDRKVLDSFVEKAMQQIQHMSETIDDFKNFFRPGKKPVPFQISHAAGHTLALIGKSFAALNIRIDYLKEGEPLACGYPNEYAQAVLVILANARDALLEHGTADAMISLRTFVDGDKAVLTVGDNAGGIPEDLLDRIFDPYFTTKGPEKGTGIGLFLAKTIIETNMGGHLKVLNRTGGAEFRIEVPLSAPH